MRRHSTDMPDMSPVHRRGIVSAVILTPDPDASIYYGLYQINIYEGTVLGVLSGGRTAPLIDEEVDIEKNPVTNQWRVV